MLPTRMKWEPRSRQAFDVITPAGRVHRYPRAGLIRRLAMHLRSHADLAVVSGAILMMIYVAGMAAEALQAIPFDACNGEVKSQTTIS